MTSLQLVVLSRQDVCHVRLPQIPFKCSVESAELSSWFTSYDKDSKDCFHVFFVPCPSHGGHFNFLDKKGVFVLSNSPSLYPLWIAESLSKDVFELCKLTRSGFLHSWAVVLSFIRVKTFSDYTNLVVHCRKIKNQGKDPTSS